MASPARSNHTAMISRIAGLRGTRAATAGPAPHAAHATGAPPPAPGRGTGRVHRRRPDRQGWRYDRTAGLNRPPGRIPERNYPKRMMRPKPDAATVSLWLNTTPPLLASVSRQPAEVGVLLPQHPDQHVEPGQEQRKDADQRPGHLAGVVTTSLSKKRCRKWRSSSKNGP